jgi:hypothetical protein
MRPIGKNERDTNRIGDISESAIITRFLQLGYVVLAPYGKSQRYDLVIKDEEEQLWKIQCKTALLEDENTVVAFDSASHNVATKNRQMRDYRGQCDYFAAYCEKIDKIYLVPVDQASLTSTNLRLAPTKNNQAKNIRWAEEYEFTKRRQFHRSKQDVKKAQDIKAKKDTKRTGDISESIIITRFLQLGYVVLTPYGGNQRYDLMVEDTEGRVWRIQCKSGWLNEDKTVIQFDTANHNVTGENRQMKHYRGQCDYFAVYCKELDKTYLIRVDEVGTTRAHLRLVPPKNKNGYRMAKDYELEMGPEGFEPSTNQAE